VSDGTPSVGPVQMSNCSYWTISGIHVTDADSLSESSEDATLAVVGGSHDQLLYNLVDHTNRCENEHGIGFFYGVSNSLAQDNEVYYFHRHAYLDFSNSNGSGAGNEFSRNYANSRNYAAPLACYPFTGGANAFMSYGGSYTLWENNIDDETTGCLLYTSRCV